MTTLSQRSFAGGEIAPSLYARTDLVKYATGLRQCRNYMIKKHGGADNRPGTIFTIELKDSSKRGRLIPFIFSSDQTYVLEFGDQYIRFIKDNAQVVVSGVASYAGGTAYVIGDLVVDVGINYYCIQAGTGHTPASSADYWYPLTDDIYEVPSPYLEADLQTLNFDQSGDIITITHASYPTRELRRAGATSWTLPLVTFAPSISAPTGVAVSGTGGTVRYWVVTAIKENTFEESVPSSEVGADTEPSSGSPRTISWSAVSGATQYNVYKKVNGVYQLIGVAVGTSFVDDGIIADDTNTVSAARNPFSGSGNYPSVSAYFQGRHLFGGTTNNPEVVDGSRSGAFYDFRRNFPLQDDDAVRFNLAGRQVNIIRAMIDLGTLIVLTSGAEWELKGDVNGVLVPGEPNPKQQSYHGSSTLRPLLIGNNAIYVQARGNVVRDLGYEFQVDGYTGNDLSILATHLVEKYTLTDWDYQQIPNSIAWIVRSDGILLGLTYLKEHQIFAWHRHDFQDAVVENVCSIPIDEEDVVYLIIKRTIDGNTVRYIERFATRLVDDIKDSIFMDSAISYDGRNTTAITMALSGSGWTSNDTLTLTASSAFFSSGDIGNEIHINGTDNDGNPTVLRCEITAYTDTTHVSVKPNKTVPTSMRTGSTTDWGKAVDELSGLDHLEGENVSIFADGFVVASPNNDSYTVKTVSSGALTLDRPYVVIHVGLPYISDIETLDIDTPQGESIADKKKIISNVTAYVEKTRGLFIGAKPPTDDSVDPLEGLFEVKIRNEEGYDDPVDLATGTIDVKVQSQFNTNGRFFLRQVDPLPASILAVMPDGLFPFK